MTVQPHLLLVDDDDDVRTTLGDVLVDCGFQVSLASGVDECLKLLDEGSYNGVITDLRMPSKSGLELIQPVLDRYRFEVPLYVVSGYSDLEPIQYYSLGCAGFFYKPVEFDDFIMTIRRGVYGLPESVPKPWDERKTAHVVMRTEGNRFNPKGLFHLGRGGVFVRSEDHSLMEKDLVRLEMVDQKGESLVVTGVVRWVRLNGNKKTPAGFGLEFVAASQNAKAVLDAEIRKQRPFPLIPNA